MERFNRGPDPEKKRTFVFREGDVIRYSARFLRSCSWYTDVPDNGTVIAVQTLGEDITLVTVRWPDGSVGKINAKNVIPKGYIEAP